MMIDRAYVHVGLSKTGTTSIQKSMFLNRARLQERGVLYPSFSSNHFNVVYLLADVPDIFADNFVRDGISTKEDWETRKRSIQQTVEQEICSANWRKLVLSAESISTFNIGQIRALKEYLKNYSNNISIIIYIREPLSWLSSLILQRLRGGKLWKDALQKLSCELITASIRRLEEVFGRDHVHIRLFEESARHEHGLFGDFLEAIGEYADGLEFEKVRKNTGSNLEQALILDRVNALYPPVLGARVNSRRDKYLIAHLEGVSGTRFDISAIALHERYDECRRVYEWLHERLPATRELYPLPPRPQSPADKDALGAVTESAFSEACRTLNDLGAQSLRARSDAAFWRARYLMAVGKLEEAQRCCREAVALDGENVQAANLLASFRRG